VYLATIIFGLIHRVKEALPISRDRFNARWKISPKFMLVLLLFERPLDRLSQLSIVVFLCHDDVS
jgi:hypothetical protein